MESWRVGRTLWKIPNAFPWPWRHLLWEESMRGWTVMRTEVSCMPELLTTRHTYSPESAEVR